MTHHYIFKLLLGQTHYPCTSSKSLLKQTPSTSLLFLEIVSLRTPPSSSLFILRCCQRYKDHVLFAQTFLQNKVRVQRSLWARPAHSYTTPNNLQLVVLENIINKHYKQSLISNIELLLLAIPNRNYQTFETIICSCIAYFGVC